MNFKHDNAVDSVFRRFGLVFDGDGADQVYRSAYPGFCLRPVEQFTDRRHRRRPAECAGRATELVFRRKASLRHVQPRFSPVASKKKV